MRYIKKLNEMAYINYGITKLIQKKFNLTDADKIGEGDNGVVYRYGKDKTLKITTDYEEALFSRTIEGEKLETVANVYKVYEYDSGTGENNKVADEFYRSRYYWIIIKEYIPHKFSDDFYYNSLHFFDTYQEKNFDYSDKDFDRMISKFINDDEDENSYIEYFELFKKLHQELRPFGIKTVSDMKASNIGYRDDYSIVYLELHIWKTNKDWKEKEIDKLYM